MTDNSINYYRFCPVSTVNGPGKRAVLWVQGCGFQCPGCFNKESWEMAPRIVESVDTVYQRVTRIPDIEGITFSGEEPFLQAPVLSTLAIQLKSKGLSIMTYTGFSMNEIENQNDPGMYALVNTCDILITGRYKKDIPADRLWIGSGNQNIKLLTDRYRSAKDMLHTDKMEWEINYTLDGEMIVTGFIPPGAIKPLCRISNQRFIS